MERNDISGDISLADFGRPSGGKDCRRLNVNRADMEHAVEPTTLGRSSFERVFGAAKGSI